MISSTVLGRIYKIRSMECASVTASMGAMNSLVRKLSILMGNDYARFRGARKKVRILNDKLGAANALLEKLSDMAELDTQMKDWRNQMREMTYDIEDCIDYLMVRFDKYNAKPIEDISEAVECPDRLNALQEFIDQIQNLLRDVGKANVRSMVHRTEACTSGSSDMATESPLSIISDLPRDMKSCLLYLRVFPKNHVIRKDRLIWRWIAEGFIPRRAAESSRESGESYFQELLDRELIETADDDEEDDEVSVGCKVHGLVLDSLTSLCIEENFVKSNAEPAYTRGDVIRRLSLSYGNNEDDTFTLSSVDISKV